MKNGRHYKCPLTLESCIDCRERKILNRKEICFFTLEPCYFGAIDSHLRTGGLSGNQGPGCATIPKSAGTFQTFKAGNPVLMSGAHHAH